MKTMNKKYRFVEWIFIGVLLLPIALKGGDNSDFNGKWVLIPEKSADIDLYGTLSLTFKIRTDGLSFTQRWGRGRYFEETLDIRTGGIVNRFPIKDRVFPTNVFMGISLPVDGERRVKAEWRNGGKSLWMEEEYTVLASQGPKKITVDHVFRISEQGNMLTYTIRRSTRKTGPEMTYVMKREGFREAHFLRLEDDWNLDGGLPLNAFLISLQGTVNREAPRLYFIYPDSWSFTYTPALFSFFKEKKNFTFSDLRTPGRALDVLKEHVKGFVVWDTEVRTSLIVAFTAAGLEDAVVVSEDLLPLVEGAGLEKKEDLRGIFRGWTDADIYAWAADRYWNRCSRDIIIWMGGEHGRVMKPGVADWGIKNRSFFNDLSSRPSDKEEYALADRLLGDMKPYSMVMGWHSYAKDLEREHVTLCSKHGLRVEGLHTLPNMSFSSQVPLTPGFEFKNNHNIDPQKISSPENKVYITCVQTDGLGIGAWLKPGRGKIPYAWEVIMNLSWMAPAVLEYYYTEATTNDYFIGCLSGPGYIYPKAVPPKLLPGLIDMAQKMMDSLDLSVFEIMDYSEGATVEGNTELTRSVVDAYYKGMPEAIGFLNGYAPAFTFAVREGRPLISYDYYLSPVKSEEEAAADLKELALINEARPYYLLMHIREYSDVDRVKSIMDRLGPDFELVPLDVFLKMAGEKPTFRERFKN
ncbi:MAG: hypothetical protein JXB26_16285 [Candidatus Aminicenantes bacterium]|nr:hypothetical protein [Candidatus Aminicenantes bacterium]